VQYLSDAVYADGQLDDWSLHGGEGERCYQCYVPFSAPFNSRPLVSVGVSGLNVKDGPANFFVGAEDVTEYGFNLKIKTWDRTQLWSVRADWIAIGA